MLINRDFFTIREEYNFQLNEQSLIKLEDAVRSNKKDLLITVAASHYGLRNRNWTIYRHDTIKHDVSTFIAPNPRPIIEKHNLKDSQVFGTVVAADYKITKFHDQIAPKIKLTTDDYIQFAKTKIIPLQKQDVAYNGLAYLELTGKIHSTDGIKKILDKQFLSVSIGARPKRLICSECKQDQVQKICNHYGSKLNDTFMLAESLEYEELSFVNRPADPFGKISRIHDVTKPDLQDAIINIVSIQDFFSGISDDKTIVCVNNICTVLNPEASMKTKKQRGEVISISLKDEFGDKRISELTDVELASSYDELDDSQFAVIQKTTEGIKRRLPINDEVNVKLGIQLLKDAEDLTEQERIKASNAIKKISKKLGIDCSLLDSIQEEDITTDAVTVTEPHLQDTNIKTVESLCEELKGIIINLKDCDEGEDKPSHVKTIFEMLQGFAGNLKWAGISLEQSVDGYLKQLGKQAITDAEITTLKDELSELKEEVSMLNDQNRELNYQLRVRIIDEIISTKKILGLTDTEQEDQERSDYSKLSYDALCFMSSDYRKIGLKIKDSAQPATKATIKTISDPTHTDSELSAIQDNTQDQGIIQDQTVKSLKLTPSEAVALIRSLRS